MHVVKRRVEIAVCDIIYAGNTANVAYAGQKVSAQVS